MKSEPILNLPTATKTLCLVNLIVFILTYSLSFILTDKEYVNLVYNLALIPNRYSLDKINIQAFSSIITHMFTHGGFLHLSINIGMLMALGSAIEKNWGKRKFIIFYFLTGVIAIIPHIMIYPNSDSPMVGASGAISGLFAAIIILLNKGKGLKNNIIGIFIFIFATVIFGILGMPGIDAEIAWIVHLGGFIAGLLIYKPIEKLT